MICFHVYDHYQQKTDRTGQTQDGMIKIPQVWQLSQCHLEFGFLCSCSEIKYLKNDGVPARYSTNTQTLFNGHFSHELRLTVLSYLSDLCRRVSTLLSRRRLHSVARGDLVINMSISGFGEHSFSATAPKAWNELSDSLQSIRTRDLTGMEIVPIPTPFQISRQQATLYGTE